jgi:hypothetical protein
MRVGVGERKESENSEKLKMLQVIETPLRINPVVTQAHDR